MMQCGFCGTDNSDQSKFCRECGTKLRETTSGEGDQGAFAGTLADVDLNAPQTPLSLNTIPDTPEDPAEPGPPGIGASSQYEILEEVGRGGMSVVYRARDKKLHRNVALKRLLAEFVQRGDAVERMIQEARNVAGLQHYHIVHVYDVDTDSDGPYIAMEYVSGKDGAPWTLQDKVRAEGKLSVHEACQIVMKLCRGASHAHAKGIIHRDIKPSNVLLTAESDPKLADFGIACVVEFTADDADGSSEEGEVVRLGTPDYMAPEQEAGLRSLDARTDIYALGGVLYYCLTGDSPRFFRESRIPSELRPALSKAMAKDREDRWATALGFANALTEFSEPPSEPAESETASEGDLMACPECGAHNPEDARFCQGCGGTLESLFRNCPKCQRESRRDIDFCGGCGFNLGDHFRAERLRAEAQAAAEDHDDESELEKLKAFLELAGDDAPASERVVALTARLQKVQELTRKAEDSEAREDFAGALECRRALCELRPHDPEAAERVRHLEARVAEAEVARLREMARQKEAARDVPGALAAWRALLEREPDDAQAQERVRVLEENLKVLEIRRLRSQANEAESRGDLEAAIELWKQIAESLPDDRTAAKKVELLVARHNDEQFEAIRARALQAESRKQFREAVKHWRTALKVRPMDSDAHAHIARLQDELRLANARRVKRIVAVFLAVALVIGVAYGTVRGVRGYLAHRRFAAARLPAEELRTQIGDEQRFYAPRLSDQGDQAWEEGNASGADISEAKDAFSRAAVFYGRAIAKCDEQKEAEALTPGLKKEAGDARVAAESDEAVRTYDGQRLGEIARLLDGAETAAPDFVRANVLYTEAAKAYQELTESARERVRLERERAETARKEAESVRKLIGKDEREFAAAEVKAGDGAMDDAALAGTDHVLANEAYDQAAAQYGRAVAKVKQLRDEAERRAPEIIEAAKRAKERIGATHRAWAPEQVAAGDHAFAAAQGASDDMLRATMYYGVAQEKYTEAVNMVAEFAEIETVEVGRLRIEYPKKARVGYPTQILAVATNPKSSVRRGTIALSFEGCDPDVSSGSYDRIVPGTGQKLCAFTRAGAHWRPLANDPFFEPERLHVELYDPNWSGQSGADTKSLRCPVTFQSAGRATVRARATFSDRDTTGTLVESNWPESGTSDEQGLPCKIITIEVVP